MFIIVIYFFFVDAKLMLNLTLIFFVEGFKLDPHDVTLLLYDQQIFFLFWVIFFFLSLK